ncbi:hypothetical protein [Planococcus shixiaomingii]|uniref:hypothetical protein n=1 Tax=Planococcus shixiaomingii TaxID=3058393 RepID=UPI00261C7B0F|nr:hypothetical protein [Planococcus sp. N022]WKA56642.1 hypothetical protein QWY21_09935 [Planococcus sp. N022]
MKILSGWKLALTALVAGAIIYVGVTFSLYEPSEDLYGFPIPKNAELVREDIYGNSYSWSPVSEEEGIPFAYELVLKLNGWHKGEIEGASVYYYKGSNKVDLVSSTEQFNILRVK